MKQITPENKVVESILEIAWHFSSRGINGECCADLSLAEFRALQTTAVTPDCSVQQIGKLLNFTKSGATRIVNRLEKKELVTKIRSAADGRVCCVAPTAAGLELYLSSMQCTSDRLEQALRKVTLAEQEDISKSLNLLANALTSLDK